MKYSVKKINAIIFGPPIGCGPPPLHCGVCVVSSYATGLIVCNRAVPIPHHNSGYHFYLRWFPILRFFPFYRFPILLFPFLPVSYFTFLLFYRFPILPYPFLPVSLFTGSLFTGFPFCRFLFYRFPFLPLPNLPFPFLPFPFLPFPLLP